MTRVLPNKAHVSSIIAGDDTHSIPHSDPIHEDRLLRFISGYGLTQRRGILIVNRDYPWRDHVGGLLRSKVLQTDTTEAHLRKRSEYQTK